MSNDAIFSLWTPYGGVPRSAARKAILDYANSGSIIDDPTYDSQDIVRIWSSKESAESR